MARVAATGWVSGRVAPARLRLYHVLFMAFSTLAAVAIAAPSVLAQQTVYQATAAVRLDPASFPGLIDGDRPSQTLIAMQQQLGEVLADRYEGLGSRLRGVSYRVVGPDTLEVIAFTPRGADATALANAAAEGMTRRAFAAMGAPQLRMLLGQQLQASLEGHPTQSREEVYLRRLILTNAMHGEIITPVGGRETLATLSRAEQHAITRALEVQEELTLLDLHKAERILARGGSDDELTAARAQHKGASNALLAVRLMTQHLYDQYQTDIDDLTQPAAAFVAAPATSSIAQPAYRLLRLFVAGLVGLLGGFVTVLLDRAVGIAAKVEELWAYRDLMRNMVLRDLRARYKNSILGYFWSLLNPLMTMLIFWLVFKVLLRNNIPMFPIFLIVALLPWNFAVTSVSSGMRSILDNSNLVKKVYFPREILPITVVLANLVNYLLALPIMLLVMAGVQLSELGYLQFSWSFAFLPVILAIQVIFLVGVALLFSTIAVFFRDTTHIIDILIQLWIFLTPVFYTLETVTQGNVIAAKAVRWLNPMASLVDFYRDILYGQASNPVPGIPALDGVLRTLLTALVILAIGAYVFHQYSGRFGEEL